MAKTLTAHDERLLMQGVQQAVQLVDAQGYTPNDALTKIANELRYTPGMLKTACFAYNTGRQLAQWNTNDSVLDKLASFPLADFEAVHSAVFGAATKVAAYIPPATVPIRSYADIAPKPVRQQQVAVEKVAETRIQKPVFATTEREYDAALREVETLRTEKFAAESRLESALTALQRYFMKSSYDRQPFAQVELFSRLRHPELGEAIFDFVGASFPKEKRANDYPLSWEKFGEAVDYQTAPYTHVDAIVSALEPVLNAEKAYKAARDRASELAAKLMQPIADTHFPLPQIDTFLGTIVDPQATQKLAGLDTSDLLSFLTGRQLAGRPADGAAQHQQHVMELATEFDDPDHLNELRKIRAQTALSQLLSDPDDPLSEADPGHVMSAYNSLVHMAPRLADQPEALGPLLRKRIVGKQEPFEAEQVLKLEEGLRKTQPTALPAPTSNLFSGGTNASSFLG